MGQSYKVWWVATSQGLLTMNDTTKMGFCIINTHKHLLIIKVLAVTPEHQMSIQLSLRNSFTIQAVKKVEHFTI